MQIKMIHCENSHIKKHPEEKMWTFSLHFINIWSNVTNDLAGRLKERIKMVIGQFMIVFHSVRLTWFHHSVVASLTAPVSNSQPQPSAQCSAKQMLHY